MKDQVGYSLYSLGNVHTQEITYIYIFIVSPFIKWLLQVITAGGF